MNDLIQNIEKLHTTELGTKRIKNNLSLEIENVVLWCKIKILDNHAVIEKRGKNWYIMSSYPFHIAYHKDGLTQSNSYKLLPSLLI